MAYLPASLDLRDLYRPGGGRSGLTPRRLFLILKWLPPDAPLWAAQEKAEQEAQKPTPDKIRERQAEFERRNAAARAKEAASE